MSFIIDEYSFEKKLLENYKLISSLGSDKYFWFLIFGIEIIVFIVIMVIIICLKKKRVKLKANLNETHIKGQNTYNIILKLIFWTIKTAIYIFMQFLYVKIQLRYNIFIWLQDYEGFKKYFFIFFGMLSIKIFKNSLETIYQFWDEAYFKNRIENDNTSNCECFGMATFQTILNLKVIFEKVIFESNYFFLFRLGKFKLFFK